MAERPLKDRYLRVRITGDLEQRIEAAASDRRSKSELVLQALEMYLVLIDLLKADQTRQAQRGAA